MAGIAALALAYFLSQFYRSFLAVLTPALEADLGATKAQLSFASGAWFIAFALMQFAVGVSLDRFGPRRTAGVLLAAGGGGGARLFAAATSPAMVTAAMTLIGIGCAPVLMASLFIFAKTFRPAHFAVLTSWFVALGSLGKQQRRRRGPHPGWFSLEKLASDLFFQPGDGLRQGWLGQRDGVRGRSHAPAAHGCRECSEAPDVGGMLLHPVPAIKNLCNSKRHCRVGRR